MGNEKSFYPAKLLPVCVETKDLHLYEEKRPPRPPQTPQAENDEVTMPARPRCFVSNSSLPAMSVETSAASNLGLEIVEENSNCSSIQHKVVFQLHSHADRTAIVDCRVKANLLRSRDRFFR